MASAAKPIREELEHRRMSPNAFPVMPTISNSSQRREQLVVAALWLVLGSFEV